MNDPGMVLVIIGFVLMSLPPLQLTLGRNRQPPIHRASPDRKAATGAALHALYDHQRPSPEIDSLAARAAAALNRVRANGRHIHH